MIINELPEQEIEIHSNSSLEEEFSAVDSSIAMEIDYNIFYNLSYSRVKKKDLIRMLVDYEQNPGNIPMVQERKRLWYYMQELKENKYLSKYIISM